MNLFANYHQRTWDLKKAAVVSCFTQFLLPMNYVWLPTKEEGFISLKQQMLSDISNEISEQFSGNKSWHHKAIRRNIAKGKDLTLYVGGLPMNLPISAYMDYASQCVKIDKVSVGPVFPIIGAFFVTFGNGSHASSAVKMFSATRMLGKQVSLTMLPYISSPRENADSLTPLLVFINCKSGGGQGRVVYNELVQFLNPNQIFLIDQGGATPGFYAFRRLQRFRVLICGGDGTVGWVLSHLELLQRHLQCPSPHIAVLPVGTGNDLARVLGCGSGWNGECAQFVLTQIADSEPVQLDRWNLLFDSIVENNDNCIEVDKTPQLLSSAENKTSGRNVQSEVAHSMVSPINIIMSVGGCQQNENIKEMYPNPSKNGSEDNDGSSVQSDSENEAGILEKINEVQNSGHCQDSPMAVIDTTSNLESSSNRTIEEPKIIKNPEDATLISAVQEDDFLRKKQNQKVFEEKDVASRSNSPITDATSSIVEAFEDLILDEDQIDDVAQY
uniref:DAGKc domain-containing protein n=1 Tax=Ciona savignyi TaxID=51511 RepID=H2ZEB5_CIOSA